MDSDCQDKDSKENIHAVMPLVFILSILFVPVSILNSCKKRLGELGYGPSKVTLMIKLA